MLAVPVLCGVDGKPRSSKAHPARRRRWANARRRGLLGGQGVDVAGVDDGLVEVAEGRVWAYHERSLDGSQGSKRAGESLDGRHASCRPQDEPGRASERLSSAIMSTTGQGAELAGLKPACAEDLIPGATELEQALLDGRLVAFRRDQNGSCTWIPAPGAFEPADPEAFMAAAELAVERSRKARGLPAD